ncbi:MAG: histidine--tRNA ligase [Pyrinomonadaceae bacterium]|nr:histidine--tRNA ligase [Pyrinomonadaceae bacterium]
MANTNPARGMRDFLPSDVRKREYVIGIIKSVYQKYGFEPLETPSVENLETLMGKYGEEGNQLIFKILERGEKIQKKLAEGSIKSENELSDLALRYDLTVPLARVVANYKDKLPKFFKRYQIQPVWRADRPARGRFREFYQCDVDAIGSSSMVVEAELISAVSEILERLGFDDFLIHVNHRQILTSILNASGIPKDLHIETLVAIDKTDKIGMDGVVEELNKRDIPIENILRLVNFLLDTYKLKAERLKADTELFEAAKKAVEVSKNADEVKTIDEIVVNSPKTNDLVTERVLAFITGDNLGKNAIEDLRKILKITKKILERNRVFFNLSLARGLSYYTGAIFEIQVPDLAGSLGGGGRYDGLIGMFGKEQIPACGFSLGLERILVVMEERGMFPPELQTNSADVMVTIWNEESIAESLKLANELRSQDLRVLVYPEADKLGKQFKYAGQINVPFVCILGENELAENKVAVKNMVTGEQEIVDRQSVGEKVKSKK